MYNVLIADDEIYVIKSLRASLDWTQLNLNVFATADNGPDALDIIKNNPIDIVITDIRMPGFCGLTLCDEIHQLDKNIQIIIISGYADFSYAQKAMKYAVIGYCLKPIDYEEITNHLIKASLNMSKIDLVTQDDLVDAIDSSDASKTIEILKKLKCYYPNYYISVAIGSSPLNIPLKEGIKLGLGRNKYAYLTKEPLLTSSLVSKSKPSEKYRCIGVETKPVIADNLKQSIESCLSKAYQFFINENCFICNSINDKKTESVLTNMAYAISMNDNNSLTKILIQIRESDYKSYFSIRAAIKLCNLIFTSTLFKFDSDDYYIYSFDQLVTQYHDFHNMLSAMLKLLSTDTSEMYGMTDFTNVNFLNVIKYLNNNYEKDISLQQISDLIHLNPNYISQLFKKETGKTFTKYLSELRISKAKALLISSELSISEIAQKVGFNDYFYFLKTFKKVTTQTPTQLRDSL